jgi:putative heme iron utilization protein
MNADSFSAVDVARRVLRSAAVGSLATVTADGLPFASLVTVATAPAGEPILLLSALAQHTRNLDADRRASLLLVAPGGEGGDPLAGARLTLTGTVGPKTANPAIRRRFLARHPEAAAYVDFADFGFFGLEIAHGHLVAGFGRIVPLSAAGILIDVSGAGALIAAEEDLLAELNSVHVEALRVCAKILLGLPDGEVQATAVDPLGIDLIAGQSRGRLDFPQGVSDPGTLRHVLADLALHARDKGGA